MKVFLVGLVLCGILSSYIAKAGWTEWRNLTMCNAKPCPCQGYEENEKKCEHGYRVQIRLWQRDPNNSSDVFKYDDEGGFYRRVECMNGIETCPGWSEWTYPENECETDPKNASRCFIYHKRYCNNPKPIYQSILCFIADDEKGIVEVNPYQTKECQCIAEPVEEEVEEPEYNNYGDYSDNNSEEDIYGGYDDYNYDDGGDAEGDSKGADDENDANYDDNGDDYGENGDDYGENDGENDDEYGENDDYEGNNEAAAEDYDDEFY
ncbi:hypothetical protein ACF0H5_022979 [Mactra antiquata]